MVIPTSVAGVVACDTARSDAKTDAMCGSDRADRRETAVERRYDFTNVCGIPILNMMDLRKPLNSGRLRFDRLRPEFVTEPIHTVRCRPTDRIALLRSILIVLIVVVIPVTSSAQSRGGTSSGESDEPPATGSQDAEQEIEPPTGFSEIELGLELEEVKRRLEADSNFAFRGDPDVSLLSAPNETLIETTGTTFIERAWFQFSESRLYSIILELNRSRLDHYTMYTRLVESYGEPTSLNPTESVWEFESVRLSLERPLSVKYLDAEAFDRIIGERRRTESLNRISRDRFLDQF